MLMEVKCNNLVQIYVISQDNGKLKMHTLGSAEAVE